MVYSGGVRSFIQTVAVCTLALSVLSSAGAAVSTSTTVACQVSDGDKKFGIQAIIDDSCVKGGLGCFKDHCRFCKVLDTANSKHLNTCLSYGVAFTSTTPVVSTQGPCQVSSGDVAAGISAVTDSGCSSGGLGCYNDHCRYCKVVQTPQSAGFMACSRLDSSYSPPAQVTVVATTDAPTVVSTSAPVVVTTEQPTIPPTDAPTSAPSDSPTPGPTLITEAPVVETPVSTVAAPTPSSEAPTAVVTDVPVASTVVPAAPTTCSIVPSVGDLEGGVSIVTDISCASGGIGCFSDVCRFCKLKTTPQSDPYMDCALVNGIASVEPTPVVVPDATEAPGVAVSETEAPVTTAADSPVPSDASTEVPASDTTAPDATVETPVLSGTEVPSVDTSAPDTPTDVPGTVIPDATAETPIPSDASTEAPVTSSDDSASSSADVSETPLVATEAPASPTTCALVASADDAQLGISVATDASCKSGGVGCVNEICRFCKVTTTIQSAPYVDCALLEDGSSDSETPVADSTTASTDSVSETPVSTSEKSASGTDSTTETPVTDVPVTETASPAVTEAPTSTTDTDAPTTDAPTATTAALPESPTCGIVAAAGDIAVGVHIATDASCSAGGLGCINDLCRFCKMEITPQSETYVDCSSLAGFAVDSEAPTTTAPVAIIPAPIPTCELVASSGDTSVGIRIITDSTCAASGIGCISDVCRFCKVITSIQSAAFIDCVTVDGYVAETVAPVPDVTINAPSSDVTCSRTASEGDLAVGVSIASDAACRAGVVGCIDDVCRFCQVTATAQSEAFVSCTSLPGYTPRTETPANSVSTPTTSDASVAQASCDLVVSAGDAAVGISIIGDATCAAGVVGCIDTVCRFCKVSTTVQSAAFVDCTSVTGFTIAADAPVGSTPAPVVSATATLAPATTASCGLIVSEGDAAVGIDITADASCQLGGVGCIDSVCRFCKVKTTEQSTAFVDCPAVDSSSTSPSDSISTPADISGNSSDASSSTSSLPADALGPPVDTTTTDAPQTTADGTTAEVPVAPGSVGSSTEAPSDASEPTEAPTTASDTTDAASTDASQGSVDTADSMDAPKTGTSDAVQSSTKDDNDMLSDGPTTDASDLLTEAPTEAPTKEPTVDVDDIDWDGSESAESAEEDSTYDDLDESLGGN